MPTLQEYVKSIGGSDEDVQKLVATASLFKQMGEKGGLVAKEEGEGDGDGSNAATPDTPSPEARSEVAEALATILSEVRSLNQRVDTLEKSNRASAVEDVLTTPDASLKSLIKSFMHGSDKPAGTEDLKGPHHAKAVEPDADGPFQNGVFNQIVAGKFDRRQEEGAN